jgi:hypothetical protein
MQSYRQQKIRNEKKLLYKMAEEKSNIVNLLLILTVFLVVLLGYIQNATTEELAFDEDPNDEVVLDISNVRKPPTATDQAKYFLDVSFVIFYDFRFIFS